MDDDWPSTPESMLDDCDIGSPGSTAFCDSPATPGTDITMPSSSSGSEESDSGSEQDDLEGEEEIDEPRWRIQNDRFSGTGGSLLDLICSEFERRRGGAGGNRDATPQSSESGTASQQSIPPSGFSNRTNTRQGETPELLQGNAGSDPVAHTKCDPREEQDHGTLFACPFWKHDQRYWKDCFGYRLKRIRDVKQHLKRRHTQLCCCDRCGAEFRTANALTHHRHLNACASRQFRKKWLFESEKERLARRSKGAPEKQWYAMWEVIFPREIPPDSPYLDESLCEHLSPFRSFLETQGPDIIQQSGLVGSQGQQTGFEPVQIRQLLQLGFQRIYNEWVSNQHHSFEPTSLNSNDTC
ncbi:hypothetical protein B0T16DRAFT_402925 [Cercophora newfieldiana]|uniref:C2H2-type domain-containing protein n=1 Tax=Cercophora newfieldiana TaxID=92897 RepID=A0AA40D047_9PEZI|nr:hypothetical protein B0T16DRAFT_402925 [Cercophora newfieldiana]